MVNGRNPIVAHEYLGDSVEGKTVFIADDIIASGESMLEVAGNLKERGAARIIANATFPLFTSGLKKFDQAVADGKLDYVVGTNLTYRQPELLTRDWYVDVDVSKYAAYFVVALNHDMSVSSIIDPIKKIEALLAKRRLIRKNAMQKELYSRGGTAPFCMYSIWQKPGLLFLSGSGRPPGLPDTDPRRGHPG